MDQQPDETPYRAAATEFLHANDVDEALLGQSRTALSLLVFVPPSGDDLLALATLGGTLPRHLRAAGGDFERISGRERPTTTVEDCGRLLRRGGWQGRRRGGLRRGLVEGHKGRDLVGSEIGVD